MNRYRITIEYDGTPYYGWQRQNDFYSVQEALEKVFCQFTREKIVIYGSGRTDTGVHALGQIAHFDVSVPWDVFKIKEAANGLLRLNGEPIAILDVEAVEDEFHARFSAKKRHYRYDIYNRRAPLTLDIERKWWVKAPLDEEGMDRAAKLLLGTHDFTTFRSTKCQAKSPIKTLDQLDVVRHDERVSIYVSARSFLHNQVRSFAGALKLVGQGRWNDEDLVKSLEAVDRKACAPVAPPSGLYLVQVDY